MTLGHIGAAALSLALALSASAAATTPLPEEPGLVQGVRLVRSGDFEGAISPLADVIARLNPDLRRREELAKAYLYLGVAYLELGQELEARGKFRETLRNVPKTKLADTDFSAQVRRVFLDEALKANPPTKKRFLPVGWVIGAGSAAAGTVVGTAVAGGGEAGAATTTTRPVGNTTTTTLGGGSPGSTTTTTRPSGPTTTTTTTTTLPGTPTTTTTTTTTTTLPGSTTTTTTSTTTTTTTTTTSTTTTTTQPPSCTYSAGPDRTGGSAFSALGGNGTCNITVSPQSCHWSVAVNPGGNSWLSLNNPIQGNGNGSVSYSVAVLNLIQSRSADIRVNQDHSVACTVTQNGVLLNGAAEPLAFESRLDAKGARGQIVVNGQTALFQEQAFLTHSGRSRDGNNRIEATVVAADGKPGTWRFELGSGYEPGSLVVLAGEATVSGAGSVVFRLTGQPGQRFVLAFQGKDGKRSER